MTNPAENIADENGHISEIRLERMALGPADASGRRSPKPTGEFFVEAFDTVIAAVSQKPDLSFMDNEEIDIPLTRWNTADADPQTMHTGTGNIFSIGDFRRGPATAVEAVGDGRIAAQAIDRFFNGDMDNIPAKPFNSRKHKQLKAVDPEQYKSIQRMARKIMPELTPDQREQSFEEVETGFDNADAIAEAASVWSVVAKRILTATYEIIQQSTRQRRRILNTKSILLQMKAGKRFALKKRKWVPQGRSLLSTVVLNLLFSMPTVASVAGSVFKHVANRMFMAY